MRKKRFMSYFQRFLSLPTNIIDDVVSEDVVPELGLEALCQGLLRKEPEAAGNHHHPSCMIQASAEKKVRKQAPMY